MYYYHFPMMNGFEGGWGFIHLLLWVGVFAFLTAITVYLVRHSNQSRSADVDPLAIIKERYAKGEINKEQYEQLKKDLK